MSKPLVLRALRLAGCFAAARALTRARAVAVTYHKVLPDAMRIENRSENIVFESEFAAQLEHLRAHYHVVTGAELRAALAGSTALPPRSVVITFDDGYLNNYTHAFPVLRRAGMTALFFVSTGFIDGTEPMWFDRLDAALDRVDDTRWAGWVREAGLPDGITGRGSFRRWLKTLPSVGRDEWVGRVQAVAPRAAALNATETAAMTWRQAREMAEAGMTIGSHTVHHEIVATAATDAVEAELAGSRAVIEREVGSQCWAFSYPNGQPDDFGDRDKALVDRAGYLCAFTQIPGFIGSTADRLSLCRMPIPGSSNLDVFRSRVSGVHHFVSRVLPFTV